MRLLVSGITTKDNKKIAYVRFEDGDKSAEAIVPDCEFIANEGFDDRQLGDLRDYLKENLKTIEEAARGVNPVTAMMKGGPRN